MTGRDASVPDDSHVFGDYEIEIVETSPTEWRAHIRRRDGRLILAVGNPVPGPVIVSNAYPTREMALEEAERAVNGGGMKAAAAPQSGQPDIGTATLLRKSLTQRSTSGSTRR